MNPVQPCYQSQIETQQEKKKKLQTDIPDEYRQKNPPQIFSQYDLIVQHTKHAPGPGEICSWHAGIM